MKTKKKELKKELARAKEDLRILVEEPKSFKADVVRYRFMLWEKIQQGINEIMEKAFNRDIWHACLKTIDDFNAANGEYPSYLVVDKATYSVLQSNPKWLKDGRIINVPIAISENCHDETTIEAV